MPQRCPRASISTPNCGSALADGGCECVELRIWSRVSLRKSSSARPAWGKDWNEDRGNSGWEWKHLLATICTQAKTIRQYKIKLRLWNSSELLNHKHQWRSGRCGPRAKVLFELVWCRSQFTWITGVVFCFAVGTAVNRTQKQETYSVNTSVCLKGAFVITLRHRLLIERTC